MTIEANLGAESAVAPVRFLTSRELRRHAPPVPRWVWDGYVASGWLSIMGGKPKASKSTIACGLAAAVEGEARTFLGHEVTNGPVVVVSEEGATTAAAKLPPSDEILVLTREQAWPKPSWPELIAAARDECRRIGAGLLLVDSFGFWASMPADAEKDSGAAQAALAPLLEAAGSGLAVLLIHHQRKGGGEDGDALRGSNAIAAAADVLIEVERLGEDAPPRFRRLVAIGRWPETPGVLVFEHDPREGSWRVVGEGDGRHEAGGIAWRERILSALPDSGPGSTLDELGELLGADRRKWGATLSTLLEAELVTRSGEGKKGDPYLHLKAPANSVPKCRPAAGTESGEREDSDSVRSRREDGIESEPPAVPIAMPSRDGTETVADLSDEELIAIFPGSELET